MRGHIRKRGSRSWAVVVDIGRDPSTGRRRQKWISVKGTKRMAEVIRDLDTNTFVEPSRLTLSEYLDIWMRDYVSISVRPRTMHGYATLVRRIKPALGSIRLSDLRPQHIQRYYADLLAEGLATQTVIHNHRLLSQALRQAVRWDMLTVNVMDRVTPPRLVKSNLRILTAPEIHRLMDAASETDYHLPLHIALHTGMRRSEICGLWWRDVDMATWTLTVRQAMVPLPGGPTHLNEPKSRASRRTISFGADTAALLSAPRIVGINQVCALGDGLLLRPYRLTHSFKTIAGRCGIHGVRLHDLRHTHASMLLASGVPIHVVSARLGHENIQTTVDTYGHLLPTSDAEAVAAFERRLAG